MQNVSNLSVQQPAPQFFSSPASGASSLSPQPATPPAVAAAPASAASRSDVLKQPMADRQNWQNLLDAINLAAPALQDYDTAPYVQSVLKLTQMAIHPDSSHHNTLDMGTRVNQSLEAFLNANGVPLPTSKAELLKLKLEATVRIAAHPFGDLGGALSWPAPLDQNQQTQLRLLAMNHAHHLGDQPQVTQTKSVLDFLAYQNPIPVAALNDPAKILEFLLSSPEGQLMGQALQRGLNGIETKNSHYDYLLAAISAQMDPESIQAPQRNKLAGFDVASEEHWGKPASAIVNGLSTHLSSEGRTSPEMAQAGAYVLLARTAPEFLIKDIPASVTYGSPAWVNLAVAAASIEAQSPGSVPNMTFAQVMLKAESAALAEPAVTQSAQRAALIDWAVANGVISKQPNDAYSPDQLEAIRVEFTQQVDERMKASTLLETDIPSRKAIALAQLKERFGEDVPFEKKALTVKDTRQQQFGVPLYDPNRAPAGLHSLLDIAMSGLGDYTWESKDPDITQALEGQSLKFDVNATFQKQFEASIKSLNDGVATTVKHLIASLPLEDRKNIEQGNLTFYQPSVYQLGPNLVTSLFKPIKNELLIQVEGGTEPVTYRLDIKNGSIKKVTPQDFSASTWELAIEENRIKKFDASEASEPGRSASTGTNPLPPNSFATARTQYIADAFVENLDLGNEDVVKQAKGATTYDKQMETELKVTHFFLDLIPFKSAIANFTKGNYLEGAIDLQLDLLGFVSLGSSKAAQAGTKALSAGAKALNVAKKIGVATIGALNPVGGLGDLLLGGAGLINRGGKFVVEKSINGLNKLKGAAGSYDLLKAAGKEHGVAAIGTIKLADQTVEASAVLNKGEWYAYDALKKQPYGPPLKGFTPQTVSVQDNVESFWEYFVGGPATKAQNTPSKQLSNSFKATQEHARTTSHDAYMRGYNNGVVDDIPGYSGSMDIAELMELALKPNRSPEEIGALAQSIGKKRSEVGLKNYEFYKAEIERIPGIKLRGMPQNFYLSQVDTVTGGECGVLANAMAYAVSVGKQDEYIDKLFIAAATKETNPKSARFIKDMSEAQDHFRKRPHSAEVVTQKSYQAIIDDLANATTSKTLIIATPVHAMTAGVIVEGGTRKWFYFDPNFGLVNFPTEDAMKKGMKESLANSKTPLIPGAFGTPTNPEYTVSTFKASENQSRVHGLVYGSL